MSVIYPPGDKAPRSHMIFQPGDRVLCVDADGTPMWEGGEYTVERVVADLVWLGGLPTGYNELRFVPVTSRSLDMEAPAPVPADVAKADNVNQPNHYARFPIEPITFINANALPYNIGNVIKYACRYDAKNGVEDLRKAIRYLEIHIETLARRERVASGEASADVWKVAL